MNPSVPKRVNPFLANAERAAFQALADLLRGPHAPLTGLYFLALDLRTAGGCLAWARLLMGQGESIDAAMRTVADRYTAAATDGMAMYGAFVDADALGLLIMTAGADPSSMRAGLQAPRGPDELLMVALSDGVFTATLKARAPAPRGN